MPQLHAYVPERLAQRLRARARARGVPVSRLTMLAVGDVVTFGGIDARFEVQPFDDTATNPL